ncbi:PREDICTED: protein FAM161A [Ceratosolen solmsi marchali]|uniref:Protein FAM161A n=1 Tax=Ceratosolen solmsi marchali TaxID=326594 RepID=A0AAJ6YSY1_9HYME|nr:PREDICTED: protein FAM161A [Ceratosolen solmsi marchali]
MPITVTSGYITLRWWGSFPWKRKREWKGTFYMHSCVKMTMDPYNRQLTPLYERLKCSRVNGKKPRDFNKLSANKIEKSSDYCRIYNKRNSELKNAREDYDSFLEFIQSIPNYIEIHHLSNEQFKQKLDCLKRKQRILLKNLRNCLEQEEKEDEIATRSNVENCYRDRPIFMNENNSDSHKSIPDAELKLKDKRYNYGEPKSNTLFLHPSRRSFSCLTKDQDFLNYRCMEYDKAKNMERNEDVISENKIWSSESELKSNESLENDNQEISVETKSLPAHSTKKWQLTLSKPFNFTLKDDAEKYITMIEKEADKECKSFTTNKKNLAKKRRIKPIPLSSKIPLYEKLMAAKEERSRIVREESALNLMSQVQPFKLECDRRALRALTHSSPDLRKNKSCYSSSRFKAKPIPRNLFSIDVHDTMLEDAYFRNLQKRIRAIELMRSSSLSPSMARRSCCKSSSSSRSLKASSEERRHRSVGCDNSSIVFNRNTPLFSERSRPSTITTTFLPHGNNLAALLRAQVSREKLERDIKKQLEENRQDQMLRLRKALISKKPAWRALRSAARNEHERDLDFRTSLRRDEAREQADRHRIQMEMMLDRVTQIPTLFERHSQDETMLQNFQSSLRLCPKLYDYPKLDLCMRKKSTPKRQSSSSAYSYASLASSWCTNSGSLTSSSGTPVSVAQSTSLRCTSDNLEKKKQKNKEKKKQEKGLLKVSINETAELIQDINYKENPSHLEEPCDKTMIHSETKTHQKQ